MNAIPPESHAVEDVEAMAAILECTDVYGVQRKLAPLVARTPPADVPMRQGLFVAPRRRGWMQRGMKSLSWPWCSSLTALLARSRVGDAFGQLRQPSKISLNPLGDLPRTSGFGEDLDVHSWRIGDWVHVRGRGGTTRTRGRSGCGLRPMPPSESQPWARRLSRIHPGTV